MGVDLTIYLIYGTKIDKNLMDDVYENEDDGGDLINYTLYDRMSGKYLYACKYLRSIDQYGEHNGDGLEEYQIKFDNEILNMYKKEIIDKFKQIDVDLSDNKFELMLISHYS